MSFLSMAMNPVKQFVEGDESSENNDFYFVEAVNAIFR